jgi:hypothetical protein
MIINKISLSVVGICVRVSKVEDVGSTKRSVEVAGRSMPCMSAVTWQEKMKAKRKKGDRGALCMQAKKRLP